ncbi:MAG: aldehyde ferredoxin oxidoreductase N-terminal domain-containing protein, partial [Candidatus Hodarchaeota archaeon]
MNNGEKDRKFWRSNAVIVNLSDKTSKITLTPKNIVRALLGGRGVNMYYLHEYLKPEVDPLSPANPLIFGTGLLTGTGAPNCSRINITTKSPESRILGDTNMGGFFPAEMRYAGIDRLVILGKAENPSYLLLKDGTVEIRDARDYWGLNTNKTQLALRKELGHHIEVACIGPAGENLVRFATVINGIKNAAGRCGIGTVMGSKNLKAIVASGTLGIPIKFPKEFLTRLTKINEYLAQSKIVQVLGRVGTPLLYEVSNYLGAIRTKNSQLNAFEDTLDAEVIHEYVEKMLSCHGCLVHCRHRNVLGGEGPEYTTIG